MAVLYALGREICEDQLYSVNSNQKQFYLKVAQLVIETLKAANYKEGVDNQCYI